MTHGRFITAAGIVALLILAGFATTWVHLGIRFDRPCRLFPQSEWIVMQTQPDAFEARLLDRRAGNRQQIDLFQFERGDMVRFRLAEGIAPGVTVAVGTEAARLESHLNRRTLDQLAPQFAEAQATLSAARTGQRAEVVDLARSEIASAQADRDRMDAVRRRTEALWGQGLASDAVRESTEAVFRRSEAELAAARHRLRVAEVGEKDEIVRAWEAHRDWLGQMLSDARSRLDADCLRCPIAGEVVTVQGDSALVRVAATDTLLAIAPVPPSRVGTLAPGQIVSIAPLGGGARRLEGRVLQVDRQASTVSGLSLYWVTMAVPNPERLPVAGVRGTVEFHGERVTLLAWLSDQLRHASDHSLGA